MRSLFAILKCLVARTRFEREMREELRLHIEQRADDLVAGGVARAEAQRRARIEFGAIEHYKEQCRDASGFTPLRLLHGIGADLRYALRRLAAAPVFTIFAVLSLAVGVGLTTAVYSIVDAVLWTDSGIADPERTVVVTATDTGRFDPRWIVSPDDYDDFRRAQRSLAGLTASHVLFPAVSLDAGTEILHTEAVDGAYFGTLGVSAALGRTIIPADEAGRSAVAAVSYTLWRSRFAADPHIVGKTVRISGRPFEIVGVIARGYEGVAPGPLRRTQLWLPRAATTEGFALPASGRDARGPRRLTMIGRLPPGQTLESARAEIDGLSKGLDRSYPLPVDPQSSRPLARGWTPRTVTQLRDAADLDLRRFGALLVVLVALVLLVACTNLANLVLARGTTRQQEFAVRRALGAARWRLVRELCAESAVLAFMGGAFAYALLRVMVTALDFEVPVARNWVVPMQPEINATVLAVSAAAMLLSLLVFGLEPALQLTRRTDVGDELVPGTGGVGVPKVKRQHRLLRWQVAISAGFFIVASMTVRYMVAEAQHDSGVDLDRIAVGHIDFYTQRWDETRARRTVARILEEAQREPGVEAAAISSGLPFGTTISPSLIFAAPGDAKLAKGEYESAILISATPAYFRTTGTRILHGRGFDDRDGAAAPPVVVLSESTSRRIFGTANAVGRELVVGVQTRVRNAPEVRPETTATVVGVAEDTDTTHFFSTRRNGDTAYRPLVQAYSPWLTIVMRADDPDRAVGAIRRAVRRADPDVALSSSTLGTGRRILAGPHEFFRAAGLASVALGSITLLLAMAGLYGVQSHIVAQRTREIGVRMSFGATAAQIRAMVLKDGYRPVVQGLLIGLFLGFVARALVRGFLSGRVELFDPWMFTLVPIPLVVAAFFACYLPARRASRVDPNVALRHL